MPMDTQKKSLIVLHETVSPNYSGLKDIKQVSEYLGTEHYGIHGITDADGNIAWALGEGNAIFYHTASGSGGVNTRGIGIEQVSRVMLDYKSTAARIKAWLHMDKELNATAKLIACIARAHNIPIVSSPGTHAGITTHYEVTKIYNVAGGHVDCWPIKAGGYYPKDRVIALAKRYYKLGYRF
jgi:hypothetical protein